MDNRESCCDAPPSCVWDETHSHLSTPTTQPEIDFARVCLCVWEYDRKMNLFSDFHSISHAIYIFIPHIIMRWQWCYSVAASMVSVSHLCFLHWRWTSKEYAETIWIERKPFTFCHLCSLTHSEINWYAERDKLRELQ